MFQIWKQMAPIKRSDVEMDTDDGRVYVVASEAYQQHPSWRTRRNGSTFWKKKWRPNRFFSKFPPKKLLKIHLLKQKMDTPSVVSLKWRARYFNWAAGKIKEPLSEHFCHKCTWLAASWPLWTFFFVSCHGDVIILYKEGAAYFSR